MFAKRKSARFSRTLLLHDVGVVLGLYLTSTPACAGQATLSWDYTASGAAGFVLYCGTSNANYSTRIDVGNTISYTLTGSVAGASYFCAVTACDPAKKESAYSNQVQFTGPAETSTAPVASFAAFPSSGAVPLTVSFANSTTGSVTGWSWNFGDGASGTSQIRPTLITAQELTQCGSPLPAQGGRAVAMRP